MEMNYIDYLTWGGMIIFIIILGAIVMILKQRRHNGEFKEEIDDLDEPYEGDFWFEGDYYVTQSDFYKKKQYFYTVRMYHENYPRWGEGQKPTQHAKLMKEDNEIISGKNTKE